jgi:hypothetical protein
MTSLIRRAWRGGSTPRRLKYFAMAAACSLAAAFVACSSCEDEIVYHSKIDDSDIILSRRACGSVAGYALSIAPAGLDTRGDADRYEPFFMVCDCYKRERVTPVQVRVSDGNVIEVRYDVSRVWESPRGG